MRQYVSSKPFIEIDDSQNKLLKVFQSAQVKLVLLFNLKKIMGFVYLFMWNICYLTSSLIKCFKFLGKCVILQ